MVHYSEKKLATTIQIFKNKQLLLYEFQKIGNDYVNFWGKNKQRLSNDFQKSKKGDKSLIYTVAYKP